MAKATKKSAQKAAKNTGTKKDTITQPPIKKTPPATDQPADEKPVESSDFQKQKETIMGKYPSLTENDFHRYDGEADESVLRRAAERAGVSYEELLA